MVKSISDDDNADEDLRSEYRFEQLSDGFRGKYVDRYEAGAGIFVIDESEGPKSSSEH